MTEGLCPSCGAPVAFTSGTALVVVCAHCQTVVARRGQALENHGKVGAIVDTDTPFQLGVQGSYRGDGFWIVGHLQKDRGGAPWDEWALEFDSGKVAWLSESEGALHLSHYLDQHPQTRLEQLSVGQEYPIHDHRFVIEELAHARTVGAAGQLPSDLDPQGELAYADLTGAKGLFATLDFGTRTQAPEVFMGTRVAQAALNIDPGALRPRVKRAQLLDARCTECNGPLELRAPDRTRRVACPYCGALLDVSSGRLSFLQVLQRPPFEPDLPLGAKGKLQGVEWTCIGFLRRYSVEEGIRYPWHEHLLFQREAGFAWLVESSGHWTFLQSVAAGELTPLPSGGIEFAKQIYKRFGAAPAITEYVVGEFYWEINAGDVAYGVEYVAPPRLISEERTAQELSYSQGTYLTPEEVKAAFGIHVPAQSNVGPAQPDPYQVGPAIRWAVVYAGILILAFLGMKILAAEEVVFTDTATVDPSLPANSPALLRFSEPFEIKNRGNLKADFSAQGLTNDWLGLEGDLVHEETGEVVSFYLETGYWSGTTSEGYWTEGNTRDVEYLAVIPPGRYVLRTQPVFQNSRARSWSLTLVSDSPRTLWFGLALGALFLWPIFVGMRSSVFETARWSQSSFVSGSDQ
ncbi:MAG: DUF4178 domain-containing protein [Myxococcota bacterium]|nr:DUF4178 domain-containing protein [Myxococcota bacterium]